MITNHRCTNPGCERPIEPGNFTAICGTCLAKEPVLCGDCEAPIEGLTLADAIGGDGFGGVYYCDACAAKREARKSYAAEADESGFYCPACGAPCLPTGCIDCPGAVPVAIKDGAAA